MVLNIKSTVKLADNLTAVIPAIITKNVQMLYTAYGRETNGVKKLDFSKTQTYKYLRGKIILLLSLLSFMQIIYCITFPGLMYTYNIHIFIFISEVVVTKFTNLKYNEINTQFSRWFSGAKNREGGKRARVSKNLLRVVEPKE